MDFNVIKHSLLNDRFLGVSIEADILSQKTINDYNFVLVAVDTCIRATTFAIWVNIPLKLLFRLQKKENGKRKAKEDRSLS